jgi:hypothetical protein
MNMVTMDIYEIDGVSSVWKVITPRKPMQNQRSQPSDGRLVNSQLISLQFDVSTKQANGIKYRDPFFASIFVQILDK